MTTETNIPDLARCKWCWETLSLRETPDGAGCRTGVPGNDRRVWCDNAGSRLPAICGNASATIIGESAFHEPSTDTYGNIHYGGDDAVLVGDLYMTPAEAEEYAKAEEEALGS